MKKLTPIQRKVQDFRAWAYANEMPIGITSAAGLCLWAYLMPLMVR